MRLVMIAFSFLILSAARCQSVADAGIMLSADYAHTQNVLYKIWNSDSPMATRQTDSYNAMASFVKKYSTSENSLYLVAEAVNQTLEQIDSLISFLDISLNASPYKTAVLNTRRRIKVAGTGKLFPSINFSDTSGRLTAVETFRGKIVFIDFWSSWCKPCREQIPELRSIYQKFKNSDFEIIGISLDDNKTAWADAIKKDKQPWLQYCELVPWRDNKLATFFSITSIPDNFLLDRNGYILGQNLSPGQVRQLLLAGKRN